MSPDAQAAAVLQFWFEETPPALHFARDAGLDAAIAERFGALHAELSRRVTPDWRATPQQRLAAVIVLDQFSRNLFRGSPAAFAQDAKAQALAELAIERGDEAVLTAKQRQFLYLPFMHGEDKASQARSVALFEALGEADALLFAQAHRDVIARFKRFPSRNEALGRTTTPAEAAWLASPEARF